MKSFIFNGFKQRLLKGEVNVKDTWKFRFTNKDFSDVYEDILPSIGTYEQLKGIEFVNNPYVSAKGIALNHYMTNLLPVFYEYKVANKTIEAEKPSFIDEDNWEEFVAKYGEVKCNDLKDLFFKGEVGDPTIERGVFFRECESDELDENDNIRYKKRGFYYVTTAEELKWCANKVNGVINGFRGDVYNNYINIVLGDNIGFGTFRSWDENKVLDFCIGNTPERPFNGIFYGNGYIIHNITIECHDNANGLIGYLGRDGIINTIRIEGNNQVLCRKKITIDHLKTDSCDINAAILCGKNYGLISEVRAEGIVRFTGFVPGVYAVRNKTDDGLAFDDADANKFFPNYLCINSPANIIPYIGYFAEGVFGTCAYYQPSDKENAYGYWKSNFHGANYTFSIYDMYGISEWAFPAGANNTKTPVYTTISGHVLFYDLNAMKDTDLLVTDQVTDWNSSLNLLPLYEYGKDAQDYVQQYWGCDVTQYLDRAVKMHKFNRVSYNTGIIMGCNDGSVMNVAINASAECAGTFVGFMGGLAGKQIAQYKTIKNVCINLTACDDGTRNHYVSDYGDKLISIPNANNSFGIAAISPIKLPDNWPTAVFGINSVDESKPVSYYKMGSVNSDGTYSWGVVPSLRFNLEGFNFSDKTIKLEHIATYTLGSTNCTGLSSVADWLATNTKDSTKDITIKSISCETTKGIHSEWGLLGASDDKDTVTTSHVAFEGIYYRFGRIGRSKFVTGCDYDDPEKSYSNIIRIEEVSTWEADTENNCFIIHDVPLRAFGLINENSTYKLTTYATMKVVDTNDNSKYLGLCLCKIGKLKVRLNTEFLVPAGEETDVEKFIFNGKLYNYNCFDIIGAEDIEFTVFEGTNATISDVYSMKIPAIDNIENIAGQQFSNNASDKCFIANYENPSDNAHVVSFMLGCKQIAGCNNYYAELKSIKNIGAFFGDIVLSTQQNMFHLSGYLYNANTIDFLWAANQDCYYNGPLTMVDAAGNDLGNVINVQQFTNNGAFFNEKNISTLSGEIGYFRLSATDTEKDKEYETGSLYVPELGYTWGNAEGFKYTQDAIIGCYKGQLMYAMPFTKTPTGLKDYTFHNRFAAFAAVCEIDSSYINDRLYAKNADSQKGNKTTFPTLLKGMFYPVDDAYITMLENGNVDDPDKNWHMIYNEPDEQRIGNSFVAGPMHLFKYTGGNLSDNHTDPTYFYSFGIALPVIAEVKPETIMIPSIIESPLNNGKAYDVSTEEDLYRRTGMFTLDQNFAAPQHDPNFWSINASVDMPGQRGVCNYRTANKYITPEDNVAYDWALGCSAIHYTPLLGDGVFTEIFSDWYFISYGKCNCGAYDRAKNVYSANAEGFGYSDRLYTTVSPMFKADNGHAKPTKYEYTEKVLDYTENKILYPTGYFGSTIQLLRAPYSGFATTDVSGGQRIYNIIQDTDNVYSDGRMCNPFIHVGVGQQGWSSKTNYVTTTGIENKAFDMSKFINRLNLPDEKMPIGLKQNIADANSADSFEGVDMFKYNFRKVPAPLSALQSAFSLEVELDERDAFEFSAADDGHNYPIAKHYTSLGPKYGFWFKDWLYTAERDESDSNRVNWRWYTKYYNDTVHYDGNVLHLGVTLSEDCIIKELKLLSESITQSAVSTFGFSSMNGAELDGLYVTDSENRNVMYIDLSMGELDGTQSWSMVCPSDGANGGLLLEIE